MRARVRAGADLPALERFALAKGMTVSRAKLGQIMQDERRRPTPAAQRRI